MRHIEIIHTHGHAEQRVVRPRLTTGVPVTSIEPEVAVGFVAVQGESGAERRAVGCNWAPALRGRSYAGRAARAVEQLDFRVRTNSNLMREKGSRAVNRGAVSILVLLSGRGCCWHRAHRPRRTILRGGRRGHSLTPPWSEPASDGGSLPAATHEGAPTPPWGAFVCAWWPVGVAARGKVV